LAKKKKFDTTEIRLTDEELALRMEQRYKVRTTQLRRRKTITLLVFLVAFAILATMCGKDIVRLKAENIALKKQQVALEKQRDELKEELTNVDDPEYIREQARKQLNLLNPGEILFLFDDEQGVEEVQEPEAAEETEQTEDAGGSDG
jgi:cell division protein FtsB